MSETQGFIDLRINHSAGGVGDDSVWPSFTDIMTVIVMIFLMALVIIMVRNFELDRELSSTVTEKEITSQENQNLTKRLVQVEATLSETKIEKNLLEAKLNEALKHLSALLLEQKSLQQANTLLEQQKEDAQSEISTLVNSEQALNQELDNLLVQLRRANILLEQQKEVAQSEIRQLTESEQAFRQQIKILLERMQEANAYLAFLKQQRQISQDENSRLTQKVTELKIENSALIAERNKENNAWQVQTADSLNKFKLLKDEYEELDVKYRDSIKPARSTLGKQIVTVWAAKVAVGLQYKIKLPSQSEAQVMTESKVHLTLQGLEEKWGNLLYVKVLFPTGSGILQEDAQNITNSLHKYDYYYK